MNITYPWTRTTRHYLFEIDLDKKTAYCSACGWTKIHSSKTHTGQKPKVLCVSRFRETNKAKKNWVRKKRPPKSNPRAKHVLSESNRFAPLTYRKTLLVSPMLITHQVSQWLADFWSRRGRWVAKRCEDDRFHLSRQA